MRLKKITLAIIFLASGSLCQDFQQDFHFPPSFQTPLSLSSDSSVYLPLETQTSSPYFPFKSTNDLRYHYLPPTGTRASTMFPSSFPVLSSTYGPIIDEEGGDDVNIKVQYSSTQLPSTKNNYLNRTENNSRQQTPIEKRQMRQLPKMISYTHPIDRIDSKAFNPTQSLQVPIADRRTIKSIEGIRANINNDDQMKASSYHGVQYIPPPLGFVPTTTETAIPILRLSNEMDLDGSYSYEALGADQTHYVQHSHMENVGTDNEEQVVEGSYSYVGDNGQTYTVHYVADANGFRASGDHLPVPPPVPEIIQRSIQYNLAEEAKRPGHLKTWDHEENHNINDNTHFLTAASTQRNLFTGRKPEAFSHNFARHSNIQDINLQSASSSPAQTVTHFEFKKEPVQNSNQNGPISPQITFLASQGAHMPVINPSQSISSRMHTGNEKENPSQSINSRMHTGNEKEIPKLVTYEMGKNDNAAQESINKQLWRWQYGMVANPEKTSISRSSSENDNNIMINFRDMTPEQYSVMLHSEIQPNELDSSQNEVTDKHSQNRHINNNSNLHFIKEVKTESDKTPETNVFNYFKGHTDDKQQINFPYPNDWYTKTFVESNKNESPSVTSQQPNPIKERNINFKNSVKNLITHHNFLPKSQTVSQSYDFENFLQDSRNLKVYATDTDKVSSVKNQDKDNSKHNFSSAVNFKQINDSFSHEYKPQISKTTSEQSGFIPMEDVKTTTEDAIESLKNNLFLKSLFHRNSTKLDDNKSLSSTQFNKFESGTSKILKTTNTDYKDYQSVIKKKPLDASEILNFVSLKNAFESNKIKPKARYNDPNHMNHNSQYYSLHTLNDAKANGNEQTHNSLNDEQKEKLQGIVKIYKTLQRNNMKYEARNEKGIESRKDSLSSDLKIMQSHKLPPLGRTGPSVKVYSPPPYL